MIKNVPSAPINDSVHPKISDDLPDPAINEPCQDCQQVRDDIVGSDFLLQDFNSFSFSSDWIIPG